MKIKISGLKVVLLLCVCVCLKQSLRDGVYGGECPFGPHGSHLVSLLRQPCHHFDIYF